MTEPRTAAGRALERDYPGIWYWDDSNGEWEGPLGPAIEAEARAAALEEARAAVDVLHAHDNREECSTVEVCRALAAIDALREGADKPST